MFAIIHPILQRQFSILCGISLNGLSFTRIQCQWQRLGISKPLRSLQHHHLPKKQMKPIKEDKSCAHMMVLQFWKTTDASGLVSQHLEHWMSYDLLGDPACKERYLELSKYEFKFSFVTSFVSKAFVNSSALFITGLWRLTEALGWPSALSVLWCSWLET